MTFLGRFYNKLKAHKTGLKLNTLKGFKENSHIQVELPCRIGEVVIESENLKVGLRTYIRSFTQCLTVSDIGRYCSIGRNVILGQDPRNHPVDWVTTSPQFSKHYQSPTHPLYIGHDVWIGHRAVIMAGITIGHGAIIGCDAVVTKDVPPYAIFAGNPAKFIRYRFDEETIAKLLQIQWWNAPYEDLIKLDFSDLSSFLSNFQTTEIFKPSFLDISGQKVQKVVND